MKQAKWLSIIGLLIIVITSGLHDVKALQFPIVGEYMFNDWLSMFGSDIGMLLWAWAFKTVFFEDKPIRYAMVWAIDLCIIDAVFVTCFDPYTFSLSKLEWFGFTTGIFVLKLALNKYWGWWRAQRIL